MAFMVSSTKPNCRAFTLAEVLVGAGVAVIGMLAVTLLNGAQLRYVKSARQSNAATLCLLERAEQLRLADWRKITSASYIQDTLLATAPKSAEPLNSLAERVTVSAFPDGSVAQKLVVQRTSAGARTTLVSGDGLLVQQLAKVELQVQWLGADGRTRTRATTTLMANGGISRMNLPAFGTSGDSPLSTPQPSATPAPGSTPTPTPAATPVPTNGNGNGNGRGNVGGKPGKN
jgi:Tfp pilus assembly protein PilV